MALLEKPKTPRTVEIIYAAKAKAVAERMKFKPQLAASLLGHPCDRFLWYEFRWAGMAEMTGPTARLVDSQAAEKERMLVDLQAAGVEVETRDAETGQAFRFSAVGGHLSVQLDAVALGVPEAAKTWHLVHVDVLPAFQFAEVEMRPISEVFQSSYAAIVVAMRVAKLDRALYLACHRGDGELFSDRLRAEETKDDAIAYLDRAEHIIQAEGAPDRIENGAICVGCGHKARCWGSEAPAPAVPVAINCRTCLRSQPAEDGWWRCNRHGKPISQQEQERGCEFHIFIPSFLPWSKFLDWGEDPAGDWVQYEHDNGKTFVNSRQEGGYTSKELTELPRPLIAEELMDTLKGGLGAELVEIEDHR